TPNKKMPFVPERQIKRVNSAVSNKKSRRYERVGKYFGGCERRGSVGLGRLGIKTLRGPYHSLDLRKTGWMLLKLKNFVNASMRSSGGTCCAKNSAGTALQEGADDDTQELACAHKEV